MKILVTGASGFIGRAVCARLTAAGHSVTRAVRQKHTANDVAIQCSASANWKEALTGCDAVIHLAAQVHQMGNSTEVLAAYRPINVDGARNLAEQAAAAGVKRFIFMSSIKVNGERTEGTPFAAASPAAPEDPYGISKYEAEQALQTIAQRTGLETTIIRPPMVYGPGVKGNMALLIKLLSKGLPLPFGCINNRRSLLGLSNLADLVLQCVEHPSAAGQTFLASDGEDLSTPDLLKHIAEAIGKSARLLPVPVSLLKLAGALTGKSSMIERLTESLQINSEHTRQTLGWVPPCSVEEEMQRMVKNDSATI